MQVDELPAAWQLRKLGDVCLLNPSKTEIRGYPDDLDVTFVPMAAVDEAAGEIDRPETRKLGQVRKGYTYFRDGDVLFAKITPCMENGKAAVARGLVNGLGCGSTEFHVLRPLGDVLPEWVSYWVRRPSFRDGAAASFTGSVGQQRVPEWFLAEHEIPVPPLQEQRRIVGRIEELARRIEEAKGLRRAARQEAEALLPAAADEMFGSAQAQAWPVQSLGELTHRTQQRDPRREPDVDFSYIDITSVESGSGSISEPRRLSGREAPSRARKVVLQGDVIFATTRPYLRSIALVPSELDAQICSTGFCVLRAKRDVAEPRWLYYCARSDLVIEQVLAAMRGAAYPAVTDKDVRSAVIPVPPLEEQRRIVAYLDSVRAKADALRRLQDETQRELDTLLPSVLDRAFRGEL